MKFKKSDLLERVLDDVQEGGFEGTILNEIVDQRRWVTAHRVVFKYLGKYYQSYYDVGSTERQDQGPWEYDEDEIECDEVEPYTETVTKYRKFK